MIRIAVLMTCHDRREKTLRCLRSLYAAVDASPSLSVSPSVFLTDDACSDGTADAVSREFAGRDVNIVPGSGDLFWAGGMRLAWRAALAREPRRLAAVSDEMPSPSSLQTRWDYFLLLNDDTLLAPSAFSALLAAEAFCREHFRREGIVSGMVCDPDDSTLITYGGEVFTNRLTGRRRMLGPSDEPQLCDWTHANILLVPQTVVEQHGILYEGYRHGQADLDYGYRARRRGIPVVVTPHACGTCTFDHPDIQGIEQQLCAMTLRERRAYLSHPLHSDADYLTMIRRCMPMRYPMTWLFRKMNLYMPRLYYWLNRQR